MENPNTLRPETFEGLSQLRPPLCRELRGQAFTLALDDGTQCQVTFLDGEKLTFHRVGEAPETYAYDCLKADRTTYFVNFECPGAVPRTGCTLILDLEQSLVTLATARLGENPRYPLMPSLEFTFGGIRREDGTVPEIRHGYTADLVGRAIDWNYGVFNVVHVYSSERYYRVAFTPRRIALMKAAGEPVPGGNPAQGLYEDAGDFIKIKDGLYVVSLLEKLLCRRRGHGNSLLFLMNLKEMHDVGRSFGTNDQGENENYVFGAFGRDFDAADVLARESTYYIR